MTVTLSDYEESIPTTSLIKSVRSFGYDLNTAVADIVDNSITANATEISIHLEWNDGEPFVAITDNGVGMSETELSHNICWAQRTRMKRETSLTSEDLASE